MNVENKKPLAVVIPIYRESLDYRELSRLRISLSHFNSDVFFIGPESLERSWYIANFPMINNVKFPDAGFANRRRYSRWMMKSALYDHFRNYEFLLICQTDAVVTKPFPNELLYGFDFDYVGAPWVPGYQVSWNPLSGRVGEDASRITKRWIQVGNGGLSLRRVRAFRRATRLLPRVRGRENEDKVFSYFSRLITLKVASRQVAGSLFMEQETKD